MVDLTGTTYALVGASIGSSYVLFSNLGLTQMGTIPLLNGRVADVKISPADKVRLWTGYFFTAARWSLGGTFLSLALDIFVYRTHSSALVRKLSLTSGLVGALVVPYTLVAIGPTNTELIVLSRDDTLRDRGDADAERVDALLQTWERRHLVRYAAFMGAWALALAALVLDNRA